MTIGNRPPDGVRQALVMIGQEIRPALARTLVSLARRVDPALPVVLERSDGRLGIVVNGVTLATMSSGAVGNVRYGREPGR